MCVLLARFGTPFGIPNVQGYFGGCVHVPLTFIDGISYKVTLGYVFSISRHIDD